MKKPSETDIENIAEIVIGSSCPDHDIRVYCDKNDIEYDSEYIEDKLLDMNIEKCSSCEQYFYSHDIESMTGVHNLCINCGGIPEGMEDDED